MISGCPDNVQLTEVSQVLPLETVQCRSRRTSERADDINTVAAWKSGLRTGKV